MDVVEYLLRVGGSKRLKDKAGRTPLWIACEKGYAEIAELLIRKGIKKQVSQSYISSNTVCQFAGAGPRTEDGRNESCLHVAARKGYITLLKLLQQKRVDVAENEREESTQSALDIAFHHNQSAAMNFLILQGAKFNPTDTRLAGLLMRTLKSNEIIIATAVIESGFDLDFLDETGYGPLHFVAKNGIYTLARLIVLNGGNVDLLAKDDTTPIFWAALNQVNW